MECRVKKAVVDQGDDGLAHAAMTSSRTASCARPGAQDGFQGRVRALG